MMMKKMAFKLGLLAWLSTTVLTAYAQDMDISEVPVDTAQPPVSEMSQSDFLGALRSIPRANVSFYAQAVDGSAPIIALNAQRAQNPASVIKLVTSFVALKHFGADYRWQTSLWSQQAINEQGQLNSPLLFKGTGDPQLVIERMDELVGQLRSKGLKQLNAPIWVDRNAFAPMEQNAGAFDGEPAMPYNALPDAALVNYRALSFRFDPGTQQVRMVPWLDGFEVNSSVQFVEGECPANGWKSTVNIGVSNYAAWASGTYYSGCGEQQWHVHAYQTSANQYAQGVFGALFKGHTGLEAASCSIEKFWDKVFLRWHDCFAPTIRWTQQELMPVDTRRSDSTAWQPLATVSSPPLSAVLRDMNFYSNNVMARMVYLNLSKTAHQPADLASSAQQTHEILAQSGLSDSSVVMGNGSGLSGSTRINAQELAQILIAGNQIPAFYDSLPRIGLEGTVKKRLTDTDMVGRGRMKTGTLNNVRAIAGYIDGKSGTRYAVVSIIHDASAQSAAGKRAHDVFMQWVGEQ